MSKLELRVPPPLVALLFGLLMWLASLLVAPIEASFAVRLGLAIVVGTCGMAFGVPAMVAFVRAKTTMNPIKASSASSLVTAGVFRFTRNPMYLSLLLYLLAWAAYLANWLSAALVPLLVLYLNRFQIEPEERALAALFGAEYEAYRAKVRRWL